MATTPVIAVLTGDLIGSTDAPAPRVEAAMAALAASARDWPEDLRFTRFRGDGWQAACATPGHALRIGLRLTASLAAAETGLGTRLSIGFGSLLAGGADLSTAYGTAFTRSGRGLDAMPRGRTWAVAGGAGLPDWVAALIPLAEWHAARWTRGQAAVAAHYLTPVWRSQQDHAARAGLTRQAWKARLDGSGIAAWLPALAAVEAWNGAGVGDD